MSSDTVVTGQVTEVAQGREPRRPVRCGYRSVRSPLHSSAGTMELAGFRGPYFTHIATSEAMPSGRKGFNPETSCEDGVFRAAHRVGIDPQAVPDVQQVGVAHYSRKAASTSGAFLLIRRDPGAQPSVYADEPEEDKPMLTQSNRSAAEEEHLIRRLSDGQ